MFSPFGADMAWGSSQTPGGNRGKYNPDLITALKGLNKNISFSTGTSQVSAK
jgi:hypothetical protein